MNQDQFALGIVVLLVGALVLGTAVVAGVDSGRSGAIRTICYRTNYESCEETIRILEMGNGPTAQQIYDEGLSVYRRSPELFSVEVSQRYEQLY